MYITIINEKATIVLDLIVEFHTTADLFTVWKMLRNNIIYGIDIAYWR